MTGGSLQTRLLAGGLAAMAAALLLAGLALSLMFERHLERRAIAEAEGHLRTLIAGAALAPDGGLTLATPPADPKFAEPYGGLYWQAQENGRGAARSRSLWDFEIALPRDNLGEGGVHAHDLPGPRSAPLLVVERPVVLESPGGGRNFRLAIGIDRAELTRALGDFRRDLIVALGLLGLALGAASVLQVRVGLRPLAAIRDRLHRVRVGEAPRLSGDFPGEVTPLVEEINTLLDNRDAAVARARGRAADLAHGLKTPLTALNSDVRRLRAAGQDAIAEDIAGLGAMMQRHVHRELTHARIAGRRSGAPQTALRPAVEAVAGAVARTPDAAGKVFDFDIDATARARIDRADLEELLGNLVENAVRHARSVVRIAGSDGQIVVADDGPGLAADDIPRMRERGVRLDGDNRGVGLGLAIVDEIADAYGATVTFERADLGGLAVRIVIPG